MAAAAQQQEELAPWGRLRLTSKKPVRESESLDLRRSVHRIGRLPSKADLIIDRPYISALVRADAWRWPFPPPLLLYTDACVLNG